MWDKRAFWEQVRPHWDDVEWLRKEKNEILSRRLDAERNRLKSQGLPVESPLIDELVEKRAILGARIKELGGMSGGPREGKDY